MCHMPNSNLSETKGVKEAGIMIIWCSMWVLFPLIAAALCNRFRVEHGRQPYAILFVFVFFFSILVLVLFCQLMGDLVCFQGPKCGVAGRNGGYDGASVLQSVSPVLNEWVPVPSMHRTKHHSQHGFSTYSGTLTHFPALDIPMFSMERAWMPMNHDGEQCSLSLFPPWIPHKESFCFATCLY